MQNIEQVKRINAACREQGISYSRFIAGLKKTEIVTNRKSLAQLTVTDPQAFKSIVEKVKAVLEAQSQGGLKHAEP